MRAFEVALAGVTTDLRKTQASWPRLLEPNARRQPQLQVEGANQTWNWVIGSLGQWIIWVIFYVRVTGSPGHHFDPVLDPSFSVFRKNAQNAKRTFEMLK